MGSQTWSASIQHRSFFMYACRSKFLSISCKFITNQRAGKIRVRKTKRWIHQGDHYGGLILLRTTKWANSIKNQLNQQDCYKYICSKSTLYHLTFSLNESARFHWIYEGTQIAIYITIDNRIWASQPSRNKSTIRYSFSIFDTDRAFKWNE